jgi:hypothetical protein
VPERIAQCEREGFRKGWAAARDHHPPSTGYEVKITRSLLGIYYPHVSLDGESVSASIVGPVMGCMTHKSAVALGRRIAERHQENSQPPVPLDPGAPERLAYNPP